MQLGLTWPLQGLLKLKNVPYGQPLARKFCWDAHCITLRGRSSLLLVHCASRYTCLRFDMTSADWAQLDSIVLEEIREGLLDAGFSETAVEQYLADCGAVERTRPHGRREVAYLNRAWEAVLAADWLLDESTHHQLLLGGAVNGAPCRCAEFTETDTALAHLRRSLGEQEEPC